MKKEIEFIYVQNNYTLYGVRYKIAANGLNLIDCYRFDDDEGRRDIEYSTIPNTITNYIQDSLAEGSIHSKNLNQYYCTHVDECIDAQYNVITQVTTHINEDSVIVECYAQERN